MEHLSTYELFDLFATYGSAAGQHFMHFVSVFFAYIVAGYLVATRLSRLTLIFITIVYSVFMMLPASASYMVLLLATDIVNEIAVREDILGVNAPALIELMSGNMGQVMIIVNPLLQFVAYLGSVIFVFRVHSGGSRKSQPNKTIESDA